MRFWIFCSHSTNTQNLISQQLGLDQSEAGIRKPGLGVFTRLSALADWLEITQVSSREIDETWWGWAEETVGRRGPARGSLQPPS